MLNAAIRYVHSNRLKVYTKKWEILGADFCDWLCDGSDVNEAFKLDEIADLNLPSDLPTTSGEHTGNKRMFAAPKTDAEVQRIIADGIPLQFVSSIRDLGGCLNSDLTPSMHCSNIAAMLSIGAVFMLSF